VSYIGGAGAVSEERWIDAVSSAADCGTTKVRLDREVWSEAVAAALRQGEPMGGPAILVHHVLCKRARATGVKVLLAGHGADELFAGYPSALPLRVAGLARQGRLLAATRLVAAAAHGRLPQAAIVMAQAARALTRQRRPLRGWPWLAIETDAVRSAIGGRDRPLTVADLVRDYLLTSLPAILRWEDRNTMAASLEGRLPFLLPELVTFCLALPESHLVGPSGENKYVLRRAVHDLLPAVVRYRHGKVGLSVPVEAWARDIPDVARRLDRAAGISGIVASWVRDRASDLRGGRAISARHLFAIWRLVGLDLWSEALGVEVSL
jgi:asparagine synthase (glutamine-hydrolysing)